MSSCNITRYFDTEKDPRIISPAKNANLKVKSKQVEAGDFYEFVAYQIEPQTLSPFCLTGIHGNRY